MLVPTRLTRYHSDVRIHFLSSHAVLGIPVLGRCLQDKVIEVVMLLEGVVDG